MHPSGLRLLDPNGFRLRVPMRLKSKRAKTARRVSALKKLYEALGGFCIKVGSVQRMRLALL